MNEEIQVEFAHMHQTAFLPGLNRSVNKGLDDKTYPGLKMTMGFAGLNCEYENRKFVIPYVNFQSLVLKKETSNKKGAKQKDA